MPTTSPARVKLTSCVVTGGQSDFEAAVLQLVGPFASATLTGCLVKQNTAKKSGGAVSATQSASVVASNSVFDSNQSGDRGGAGVGGDDHGRFRRGEPRPAKA